MDEDQGQSTLPMIAVPVLLVGLVVLLLLMRRSRSESRADRAFKPIVRAIDDSDLPERLKDILRSAVGDVRNAANSIGDAAEDLKHRS